MIHSGEVTAIYENNVTTKFGDKTAYKVVIAGKKCDFGFKKPTFSRGDTVTVTGEEGQYGIKVTGYDVARPTGDSSPSSASSGGVSKAEFLPIPMNRDRLIIRQNALTAAVNFLKESATWPSTEEILNLAREFEAYTSGDSDWEAVQNASEELLG